MKAQSTAPALLLLLVVGLLTAFTLHQALEAQSPDVIYLTALTSAEGLADPQRLADQLDAQVVRPADTPRSFGSIQAIILDHTSQNSVDRA
jgi:hypothetical protein